MTITKDMIGCHGDSSRGIYLGELVIEFAINYGFTEYQVYANHDDDCHNQGPLRYDDRYYCNDDGEHLDYYVEMQDKAVEFLNKITEIPYAYWSVNENGDFGLWPDLESIADQQRYGNDEWACTEEGYVIHVTDHGNVTLYEIGEEIWSVV